MTVSLEERLYEGALRAIRPVAGIAGVFDGKVATGLRGRAVAVQRLESWAATSDRRLLVWMHAPSVGEGLMASAIIDVLRARAPDIAIAFTHFSPSAERLAATVHADVHAYLPWDVTTDVQRAVRALEPRCIAFVRTEIWPTLTRHARTAGARLALVNAVLPAGSSRLQGGARRLLSHAYARLDALGAVAQDDARRYEMLGVPPARMRVTGDARFDQVWQRVSQTRVDPELSRRLRLGAGLVIVAGSTWPADERRLLPAFAARDDATRLIIAPHEPTARYLAQLEAQLQARSITHVRLGDIDNGAAAARVVIVDRTGVLADLYAAGDVAYVGGGFQSAGLHSVIEPAAHGVPVLFGPRHANAREAQELVDAGGARCVGTAAEIGVVIRRYSENPAERAAAGANARRFVQERLGGAAGNAELILELLR
jgi:3-deoxy-D-manno-octulosonic-acid transferase